MNRKDKVTLLHQIQDGQLRVKDLIEPVFSVHLFSFADHDSVIKFFVNDTQVDMETYSLIRELYRKRMGKLPWCNVSTWIDNEKQHG